MHCYKITIIIYLLNENSTFKYIYFIEEITISMIVVGYTFYWSGGGSGDAAGGGGIENGRIP